MKVAEKRQHKNENEEIESKATTDKRRWITRIKKNKKETGERSGRGDYQLCIAPHCYYNAYNEERGR